MRKKFTLKVPRGTYATKWVRPYTNGKPTIRTPKPTPGIYFIRTKHGRIVYVGFSTYDVKKTLYRHFQKWDEQDHNHATYGKQSGHLVRIVTGIPAAKLSQYEQSLIRRLQPRDNGLRYTAKQWTALTESLQDDDIFKLLNHGQDDDLDLPF